MPTEIQLTGGAVLVWMEHGGCWSFQRNGIHIRYLNIFEQDFVECAIKATLMKQDFKCGQSSFPSLSY